MILPFVVLGRSLLVLHDHRRLHGVRADREQLSKVPLVAAAVPGAGRVLRQLSGPAAVGGRQRFRVVSLRRRHLRAVRDQLRGGPVSAARARHRAQVAVGPVPLERLAGRTGTGPGVAALRGRRGFLLVLAGLRRRYGFVLPSQPENRQSSVMVETVTERFILQSLSRF